MNNFKTSTLLLIGSISLFSLSSCEQVEQATNTAIDKAKQSSAQVVDEATQNDSLEKAKQSASQALDGARQKAADLLGQASEFLSEDQHKQDIESPAEKESGEANDDSTTAL